MFEALWCLYYISWCGSPTVPFWYYPNGGSYDSHATAPSTKIYVLPIYSIKKPTWHWHVLAAYTPWKKQLDPEKLWLGNYFFPFRGNHLFGGAVIFREGICSLHIFFSLHQWWNCGFREAFGFNENFEVLEKLLGSRSGSSRYRLLRRSLAVLECSFVGMAMIMVVKKLRKVAAF